MKIVDARSGLEIKVGTKIGFDDGEWLKLLSFNEKTLRAQIQVCYRSFDDDKTVVERPSAMEIAERMADRSGRAPELPPLKRETLDVELLQHEDFPGFKGECVLILPS